MQGLRCGRGWPGKGGAAPRNENGSRVLDNDLERTLDTVENLPHDAGSKGDREGLEGALNGIADGKARSLLVALHGAAGRSGDPVGTPNCLLRRYARAATPQGHTRSPRRCRRRCACGNSHLYASMQVCMARGVKSERQGCECAGRGLSGYHGGEACKFTWMTALLPSRRMISPVKPDNVRIPHEERGGAQSGGWRRPIHAT